MRGIKRRAFLAGLAGGAALVLAGCQAEPAQHPTVPTDLQPFTGLRPGSPAVPFPAFVTQTVQDGYQFALERPDVLKVLPCYCGCGLNSGHKSNLDCFVNGVDKAGAVVFDDHASFCQTCLDIARDAKGLLAQGKTLPEIRATVDERNSSKGPGTDTPKPVADAGTKVG